MTDTPRNKRQAVVLLHGIGRSKRSMSRAAAFLGEAGYEILNIDYPSRSRSISDLATLVKTRLKNMGIGRYDRVHFLTHSMGGIVARACLQQDRLSNLGRVVMLAPPNRGSEVADFLAGNFLYRKFYGPAGQDLQTGGRGVMDDLGPVDFPLGVIAGTRSLDPVSSLILPSPNDGKVSVENTRVEGLADHLVLPVNHTFIMRDADVLRQVVYFLTHGRFERNAA